MPDRAFAAHSPTGGIAVELGRTRAALADMTRDRDAWRERALAGSTISASARRLRMLRTPPAAEGQGRLLDG